MELHLPQTEKYDWVEFIMQWELCNQQRFDHIDKWYIHEPEKCSVHLVDFAVPAYNNVKIEETTTQSRLEDQIYI